MSKARRRGNRPKIVSFLIKLASNRGAMERYLQDRRATVEKAGLSEEEQRAILSGDPQKIRRALGEACEFPANIYGHIYGPQVHIYFAKPGKGRSGTTKEAKSALAKALVKAAAKIAGGQALKVGMKRVARGARKKSRR